MYILFGGSYPGIYKKERIYRHPCKQFIIFSVFTILFYVYRSYVKRYQIRMTVYQFIEMLIKFHAQKSKLLKIVCLCFQLLLRTPLVTHAISRIYGTSMRNLEYLST